MLFASEQAHQFEARSLTQGKFEKTSLGMVKILKEINNEGVFINGGDLSNRVGLTLTPS